MRAQSREAWSLEGTQAVTILAPAHPTGGIWLQELASLWMLSSTARLQAARPISSHISILIITLACPRTSRCQFTVVR